MAESLRQVKNRIRSVESIHKMTRAMEMVSSARLRSLQKELSGLKQYFSQIDRIKNNILASFGEINHVLVKPKVIPKVMPRAKRQKILFCPVTTDTGLCGNYNSIIIRMAEEFIRKNSACGISLLPIGKKGLDHFKRFSFPIEDSYTQISGRYSAALSDKIANSLIDKFLSGKFDEIYIAYTNFESVSRRKAVVEKLLNIEKSGAQELEYLTEPGIDAIAQDLFPLYVTTKVRLVMLSAVTTEHSVRIVAMHEATDNAKELLEDLTLLRNKIRQANITGELIEVISAADAMKG